MNVATIYCRKVLDWITLNYSNGCYSDIGPMSIDRHVRCHCISPVSRATKTALSWCWNMVRVWIPKRECAIRERIAIIVSWVESIVAFMRIVVWRPYVDRITMNDKIQNYRMLCAMPSTVIRSACWIFCRRRWKSRGFRFAWRSRCCIWPVRKAHGNVFSNWW